MAGPHTMSLLLVLVTAAWAVATVGEAEMAFVLAGTPSVLDVVTPDEVDSVVLLGGNEVFRLVVAKLWLVDVATAWSIEVFSLASSLSRTVIVILESCVNHGRLWE